MKTVSTLETIPQRMIPYLKIVSRYQWTLHASSETLSFKQENVKKKKQTNKNDLNSNEQNPNEISSLTSRPYKPPKINEIY